MDFAEYSAPNRSEISAAIATIGAREKAHLLARQSNVVSEVNLIQIRRLHRGLLTRPVSLGAHRRASLRQRLLRPPVRDVPPPVEGLNPNLLLYTDGLSLLGGVQKGRSQTRRLTLHLT
jgi:hypothetical protein